MGKPVGQLVNGSVSRLAGGGTRHTLESARTAQVQCHPGKARAVFDASYALASVKLPAQFACACERVEGVCACALLSICILFDGLCMCRCVHLGVCVCVLRCGVWTV